MLDVFDKSILKKGESNNELINPSSPYQGEQDYDSVNIITKKTFLYLDTLILNHQLYGENSSYIHKWLDTK